MNAPADWYRRTYPDGPDHDPRCLAVLAAWQGLHNIRPIGRTRRDGGFRACGVGVEVHTNACLATYDMDELTRLVLAAHRHHCRVEISDRGPASPGLSIRVHPRSAEGDSNWQRHPGLRDLADRARRMAEAAEAKAGAA